MTNKRYLITGSGGQLADTFTRRLKAQKLDVVAKTIDELDITRRESLDAAVDEARPDVILNCAAYNFVDQAESEPKEAYAVNVTAVQDLAGICKERGLFLVHYGTDYVFDGTKSAPYTEMDRPNPLNVYGRTKLEGERAVIASKLQDFLVLRLSWVFGPGKMNFLYKLEQWAENSDSLKIAVDEISVPTYTEDVVDVTLAAMEKGLTGLYHAVNTGSCSRYKLAEHYFGLKGIERELIPASASVFASKAKRPLYSALSNGLISKELGIKIPTWEDALERYVKNELSPGNPATRCPGRDP